MTTKMTAQQQAMFIDNVDWARLIPAAIDLFKHIQANKLISDWNRTIDIVKEILEALAVAEQQLKAQGVSAQAINWAALLPIILKFIIPILINLGDNETVEV